MDIEQGLRDYLETKASVAYMENELNQLYAKKDRTYDRPKEAGQDDTAQFHMVGLKRREDVLDARIARLTAKLEHKRYALRKLDALLSALDERERFVARKFYIEHLTWRDVVSYYNMEMPSPREVDALKAVRKRMLNKIIRVQRNCS
ncbi:MAG: hypothetical protein ACOYU3_07075 [Bacillota bacterium]